MIIADLFREQSSPWETITRSHIKQVWKAATKFLRLTTTCVADAATSKALFQKVFEPALNQLLETLNAKATELLTPHQKNHPITYNQYFIDALQKVRNQRRKDEYTKIVKDFFQVSSLNPVYVEKDLNLLVAALVEHTEPDMNRSACSEALDCMESYYKVALTRFVDDVAVEIIEAKLVSPLYDIFSPISVSLLADDVVTGIAGESEENRAQRDELVRQLEVLMKGYETCKHFIGIRVLSTDDSTIQKGYGFGSADHDSSDYSEGNSEDDSEDGIRSLSDILTARGSQPFEEVEVPEPIEISEDVPPAPEDPPSVYFKKSKKDKKKNGKKVEE